jgi:hypothetical protein
MTRLLVAALVVAPACLAGPVKVAPSAVEQAAKEFRATPGQTKVYVFRDQNQWETGMADNERMSVELDGALLGVTVAKTFLVTVVSPGPHELASIADTRATLKLDAKPGDVLYVFQEAKYLVGRNTALHLVDAADAQRRIQGCYLVASFPPPAPPQFLPEPRTPPGS